MVQDGAGAELKDGVLTLRVPKMEPTPEPRARKVQVR
ncbi:MAG TPA: Hsp20 family protein [Thermoplasmata archaeon]|nr:Hsp20 family protein [Thermoplasmata archaeon]